MKTLILLLCTGLFALGCSKSEPAAPPVASAAPAAAPVAAAPAPAAADPAAAATVDPTLPLNNTAPAAAAPVAAAKAVPTEADYEVQAESAITPANAAQVLAAIDAQIGK
jgi:hypothetical protein